ncbi:MAG: hypothetical protein KDC00_13590 [Flavobacteriales bacterium]|nr:hypothetical protein [Flavobacteriales bacterium]
MNTRVLLAGLASGVAGFLLGWIIFGMLLMDYLETGMIHYEGLHKPQTEMNLGLVFVSNLIYGLMLAWLCARSTVQGAVPGLLVGTVVGVGVYLSMALMFLAFLNWYSDMTVAVADVVANTVWSAGMGAVAGLVLKRKAA